MAYSLSFFGGVACGLLLAVLLKSSRVSIPRGFIPLYLAAVLAGLLAGRAWRRAKHD